MDHFGSWQLRLCHQPPSTRWSQFKGVAEARPFDAMTWCRAFWMPWKFQWMPLSRFMMPCFHVSYGRRSGRSVKASSLVVQGSGRCSGDCSITFRPWNQPTRRSLEKHPSRRRFPWFDWVMSWHFHGPDPKSLECTINLQHPSLSSPNHPISRCICWSAPQVFHLDTMTSLENNVEKKPCLTPRTWWFEACLSDDIQFHS